MLEVHAIAGPTGRLLVEMLREKGLVGGRVQGVVNYGHNANPKNLPTLNENAGRVDKYRELVKLDDAGVRTIPFSQDPTDLHQPIFGRKLHHAQGRDIVVINGGMGGVRRDFYTQLVPKAEEFRVWAFRDKHLATYQKVRDYPGKTGRGGRNKEVWNWHNGYAYQFVTPDDVPAPLKKLGIDAVKAMELDFGAVDILLGQDRHYYVLEVNSAPGVQDRRQGITSLVNSIERWAKGGFVARN